MKIYHVQIGEKGEKGRFPNAKKSKSLTIPRNSKASHIYLVGLTEIVPSNA